MKEEEGLKTSKEILTELFDSFGTTPPSSPPIDTVKESNSNEIIEDIHSTKKKKKREKKSRHKKEDKKSEAKKSKRKKKKKRRSSSHSKSKSSSRHSSSERDHRTKSVKKCKLKKTDFHSDASQTVNVKKELVSDCSSLESDSEKKVSFNKLVTSNGENSVKNELPDVVPSNDRKSSANDSESPVPNFSLNNIELPTEKKVENSTDASRSGGTILNSEVDHTSIQGGSKGGIKIKDLKRSRLLEEAEARAKLRAELLEEGEVTDSTSGSSVYIQPPPSLHVSPGEEFEATEEISSRYTESPEDISRKRNSESPSPSRSRTSKDRSLSQELKKIRNLKEIVVVKNVGTRSSSGKNGERKSSERRVYKRKGGESVERKRKSSRERDKKSCDRSTERKESRRKKSKDRKSSKEKEENAGRKKYEERNNSRDSSRKERTSKSPCKKDRKRNKELDRSGSRKRGRSRSSKTENSRSQKRERSRSRRRNSGSGRRERSKSRKKESSRSRNRGRSRSDRRERSRSKRKDRSRSKRREKSRSRKRDRSRSKRRDSSRSKKSDRSGSKKKEKSPFRKKEKSRSKEKDMISEKSRSKKTSVSHSEKKEKMMDRERSKSSDYERSESSKKGEIISKDTDLCMYDSLEMSDIKKGDSIPKDSEISDVLKEDSSISDEKTGTAKKCDSEKKEKLPVSDNIDGRDKGSSSKSERSDSRARESSSVGRDKSSKKRERSSSTRERSSSKKEDSKRDRSESKKKSSKSVEKSTKKSKSGCKKERVETERKEKRERERSNKRDDNDKNEREGKKDRSEKKSEKSNDKSREKRRGDDGMKSEERRRSEERREKRRARSKSPLLLPTMVLSEKKRRSRSRSRNRGLDIDKKKLLEIARKNALSMMKQGVLPMISDQNKMSTTLTSGGKTVHELTDFCKSLIQKEGEDDVSLSSLSNESDSESEKPFHHPFLIKDRSNIVMNIKNCANIPVKTNQEKRTENAQQLRLQFPVSSGQQHRKTESEWVPVSPKKDESISDKGCVQKKESTLCAAVGGDYQAEVMSKAVPPPLPSMSLLPPPPPPPQLSTVLQQLPPPPQTNRWNDLQSEYQQMHTGGNPSSGLFTGSTGVRTLTPSQLASGAHAWAKKDQLMMAAPVASGMGMSLLQKMGWRPGEGLGKHREGALEPISLPVKTDKRGLVSADELRWAHRSAVLKGVKPSLAVQTVDGKHPVSFLIEYCTKMHYDPPVFTCVFQQNQGPSHKRIYLFKVEVNGVEYKPMSSCANKKQAKCEAAMVCLKALGLMV